MFYRKPQTALDPKQNTKSHKILEETIESFDYPSYVIYIETHHFQPDNDINHSVDREQCHSFSLLKENYMTAQQKNKEIAISVIVPVHNVEAYLNECLSSLLFQSLESAEFIVIDDGSTDKSGQICDEFASKDSRFKVIHQENKGTLAARKTAFAAAKGKWCICLDGDDKLPFNRVLEIEVALANKYDSDILRFDMDAFGATPERIQAYFRFRNPWYGIINTPYEIINAVFSRGTIGWGMADKIYRTSIVKRTLPFVNDTFLISGTDCYQFFLICYFSSTFQSIKTEPLYSYRMGCGISTSTPNINKINKLSKILFIPSYLRHFLESEKQEEKYNDTLDRLTDRLLEYVLSKINCLPISDSAIGFDSLFINPELRDLVVDLLIQKYWLSPIPLSKKIKGSCALKPKATKINRIGIFYPRLSDDIGYVIYLQISQFLEMGYRVTLFTEEVKEDHEYNLPSSIERVVLSSSFKQGRSTQLRKHLKEHNIDLFIHHAAHSNNLFFDGLVTKSLGIRFCITSHEISPLFLLDKYCHLANFPFLYQIADAVVVLNTMDLKVYSALGIPTFYVKTPVPSSPPTKPNNEKHLVWISRFDQFQINYVEVLEIFRLVCEKVNDVVCHISGHGLPSDTVYINNYIKSKGLENKIIYEEVTPQKLLETADVQLIISTFEDFPVNLIRAKLHGVQVVLYKPPFFESIVDKKGLIPVPQHSVRGAADAIIELLLKGCTQQVFPLAAFKGSDYPSDKPLPYKESWKDIISNLENGKIAVPELDQDWLSFWKTILFIQSENLKNKSSAPTLSSYDKKKIERYDTCLSFLLTFFPPQSIRYRFIKKIAKRLYGFIK